MMNQTTYLFLSRQCGTGNKVEETQLFIRKEDIESVVCFRFKKSNKQDSVKPE